MQLTLLGLLVSCYRPTPHLQDCPYVPTPGGGHACLYPADGDVGDGEVEFVEFLVEGTVTRVGREDGGFDVDQRICADSFGGDVVELLDEAGRVWWILASLQVGEEAPLVDWPGEGEELTVAWRWLIGASDQLVVSDSSGLVYAEGSGELVELDDEPELGIAVSLVQTDAEICASGCGDWSEGAFRVEQESGSTEVSPGSAVPVSAGAGTVQFASFNAQVFHSWCLLDAAPPAHWAAWRQRAP